MIWTMFGYEGDSEEMTRHRLRQGNLMGPAGLPRPRGQRGDEVRAGRRHASRAPAAAVIELGGDAEGTSDELISEAAIRSLYRHWREVMEL